MKVYELLDSPDKWCQGCYARDFEGNELRVSQASTKKAVCWCLEGAILKCHKQNMGSKIWSKIGWIIKEKHLQSPLSVWNDAPERTFEEVIALCKELDI